MIFNREQSLCLQSLLYAAQRFRKPLCGWLMRGSYAERFFFRKNLYAEPYAEAYAHKAQRRTPQRIDKKVAKLSLSQEFLNCLGRILESISYFLRIS